MVATGEDLQVQLHGATEGTEEIDGMSEATDKPLVLIVEDELLIATALEIALELRGCRVLGPVATIAQTLALLETARPNLALIDYQLASTTTENLLPELEARGIPACVLTGYGRQHLPAAYARHTVLEKPFSMQQLMSVLEEMGSMGPAAQSPSR